MQDNPASCSGWENNPASCSGWENNPASRSGWSHWQHNPHAWESDHETKWSGTQWWGGWADPNKPAEGAPLAGKRWLQSDAHTLGVDRLSGASAAERAEEHARVFPLRDVSCCDVKGVSCGDASASDGKVADVLPFPGYDVDYFHNLLVDVHMAEHNISLKWFREMAEGWRNDRPLVFDNGAVFNRPRMVKKPEGGEDFSFEDGGPQVSWTWESMIAHLESDSLIHVFNLQNKDATSSSVCSRDVVGDQQPCTDIVPCTSSPRTLVGCELVCSGRIDTKRHAAAKKGKIKWPEGKPMFQWDFMIQRSDGTVCCLHPNYSNNKVAMYEGPPVEDHDVPRNGLGGIINKKKLNKDVTMQLRFDSTKTPPGVKSQVIIRP